MFQLLLVDPRKALCEAWRTAFADLPQVEIVHGLFEDIPDFDCMVSAANSFGLMDGGVDLAIIRYFGAELEKKIQRHILTHYFGEQMVGTSFIMPVGNAAGQYVAHTPTMRVPEPITGTDNVYKAMKALLEAVYHFNEAAPAKPISKVVCPGLGTATGRMLPQEAARQMALAYQHFMAPPSQIDWKYAQERHFAVQHKGRN